MKTLPLIFAVISALMPVITQKTGLSEKYGFKMKMLCAFMYLATGIASAASVSTATQYSFMILGALAFGVLGDFFLSYKKDRYFPVGMAFFALGHIAYFFTFLRIGQSKALYYAVTAAFLAAVILIPILLLIRRLKFKISKTMIVLYSAVLVFFYCCTIIMGRVCTINGKSALSFCLMFGGTLFFLSDIMIGIGKGGIKRPEFLHNAVSYTYFAAQTLFALSILFQ